MAPHPNDSGHSFPYSTDNWRVWWDAPALMWRGQLWSGKGATISSPVFEANDVKFVSEGRFLRFVSCECKAGIVAFEASQDITVDCLRLMPRTQAVAVPTIGAGASSKVFG